MQKPLISVLLPVYNCENYVLEAVQSILQQTYSHFELLIIDDCSTDSTVAIIQSLNDDRIQLIQKPKNSGYTNSLNYGLGIAKGKYIARMDGDDISLPTRFEKQVAFLEANEEVVLCGTQYQIIDTNKKSMHPLYHDEIKVKLLSGCYIAHPTVMFKKCFFDKNNLKYNPEMEPAEDYELWSRLVFLGQLANLPEVLLYYRVHQQQTSAVRAQKQSDIAMQIKGKMFEKILKWDNYSYPNKCQRLKDLLKNESYLKSTIISNQKKNIFSGELYFNFVQSELIKNDIIFFKSNKKGNLLVLFEIVLKKPFFFANIGSKFSIKFILRSFGLDL